MGHTRWTDAWDQSPLATVLFVATLVVFVVNAAAIATGHVVRPGARWKLDKKRRLWLLGAFLTLLAANWLYRIFSGLR